MTPPTPTGFRCRPLVQQGSSRPNPASDIRPQAPPGEVPTRRSKEKLSPTRPKSEAPHLTEEPPSPQTAGGPFTTRATLPKGSHQPAPGQPSSLPRPPMPGRPHQPWRALKGRSAVGQLGSNGLKPEADPRHPRGGRGPKRPPRAPRTAPPLTLLQRGQGGAAPQPPPQSATARPAEHATLLQARHQQGLSSPHQSSAQPTTNCPDQRTSRLLSNSTGRGGSASFAAGTGEILISSLKSGRAAPPPPPQLA
ncbi:proline-rich protein HaeIII subfamily 1-like [Pleurodeles waltl]|uniref:proline-rich protein HaeIII subfamily 1-like n=1 Tax=Pleurodeles waltl TaxID=8319 RepID=UPI0037097405